MNCSDLNIPEFSGGCGCHIIGINFIGKGIEEIPKRSISEVCIQADNEKDDQISLLRLLAEVQGSEKNFTTSEFEFIIEHIQGYIDTASKKNTYTMTYENPNS